MPNNHLNFDTITKSHQACNEGRFIKNAVSLDITGLLEGNANGR